MHVVPGSRALAAFTRLGVSAIRPHPILMATRGSETGRTSPKSLKDGRGDPEVA